MIFDELSKDFFFCFVLERLGVELDGGGGRLDAPSPEQPEKFLINGLARVK